MFRLYQLIYLIFKAIDYGIFLVLIIASVTEFIIENYNIMFVAVFIIIGTEMFYDVINFLTKIWLINRLSPIIVVVIYICYSVAFYFMTTANSGDITDFLKCFSQFWLLWLLLGIRFVSFLLEIIVDYLIDRQLHNVLVRSRNKIKRQKENVDKYGEESEDSQRLLSDKNGEGTTTAQYRENEELDSDPSERYLGSICIWSSAKVFTNPVLNDSDEIYTSATYLLYIFLALTCLVLWPLIITICLIYVILLIIFRGRDNCLDCQEFFTP